MAKLADSNVKRKIKGFRMSWMIILVTILLIALSNFLPALVWYTFDDQLSVLIKNEDVGKLNFLFVYSVTLFFHLLFRPSVNREVKS